MKYQKIVARMAEIMLLRRGKATKIYPK
jgi:hypothetical protein